MTVLETILAAVATGFFGALVTGAGVYLKLGRSVLTREDHDKECEKNMSPVREDIAEIKATTRRLEDKQDDSSKDLGDKMQKILLELLKKKGGG